MGLFNNINRQYVYRKDNEKWSFYDENNRPIGIEYETIEKAIDALYQYLELVEDSTSKKEVKNVQYS
jgi:hypothetical protein